MKENKFSQVFKKIKKEKYLLLLIQGNVAQRNFRLVNRKE